MRWARRGLRKSEIVRTLKSLNLLLHIQYSTYYHDERSYSRRILCLLQCRIMLYSGIVHRNTLLIMMRMYAINYIAIHFIVDDDDDDDKYMTDH